MPERWASAKAILLCVCAFALVGMISYLKVQQRLARTAAPFERRVAEHERQVEQYRDALKQKVEARRIASAKGHELHVRALPPSPAPSYQALTAQRTASDPMVEANNLYYGRNGLLVNFERAKAKYEQAAELGFVAAYAKLGSMHQVGEGCEASQYSALVWAQAGLLLVDTADPESQEIISDLHRIQDYARNQLSTQEAEAAAEEARKWVEARWRIDT